MIRIAIATSCLAVFGGLCWDASTRLAEIYPTYYRCLTDPVFYAGRKVWISPNRVTRTGPDGFEVHSEDRIRVISNMAPPVGAWVMVHGTFQADGSVKAISSFEERGFRWRRRGVHVISLIVLVAAFFYYRRLFVWRDGAFHPR